MSKSCREYIKELKEENKQLKEQLAEKDDIYIALAKASSIDIAKQHKEIEDLKAGHKKAMENALNDFLNLRAEFSNQKDKIIEKHNQDKIELLERMKEDFETILDKAIKNCSMNERYYDQIFDRLDELITELKEKRNEA